MNATTASTPAIHEDLVVPSTLDTVLDPVWLAQALAHIGGGAPIDEVVTVEVIRTMATKVRFTARFAGSDMVHAFCLKSFLDVGDPAKAGGSTTVLEADFYARVAPHVPVRVPECVSSIVDRDAPQGIIIMRDLIVDGAQFCSALEAFTADQAAQSLEQLASLHAARDLLTASPLIVPRVEMFAKGNYVPQAALQDLLDGPRGARLSTATKDAGRLVAALGELATRDQTRPQFLVHGDCHAGNIFRTAEGAGLIDWQLLQSGGWALDVAYHLAAVLPVEVAEQEERRLLGHYLGVMRGKGFEMPDADEALRQYREAAIYGFYLWAITRRVDPPIIEQFTDRLGHSVARNESHRLLEIA